jgi:hypothetical protein
MPRWDWRDAELYGREWLAGLRRRRPTVALALTTAAAVLLAVVLLLALSAAVGLWPLWAVRRSLRARRAPAVGTPAEE